MIKKIIVIMIATVTACLVASCGSGMVKPYCHKPPASALLETPKPENLQLGAGWVELATLKVQYEKALKQCNADKKTIRKALRNNIRENNG